MNNSIIPFYYREKEVRVIKDEQGNPWWVAKDVCDVLEIFNSRDAVSRLDNDEKNTVGISDGIPGNPNMTVVSESGLYTLIMRSNKQEAKKFRRWVTHEVLPSIRKTGAYVSDVRAKDFSSFLDAFNFSRLKPSQRIRVMEIASRVFQLDNAGRADLLECYGMLCASVGVDNRAAGQPDRNAPIQQFLNECCDIHPANSVSKQDVFAAYCGFAGRSGRHPLSKADFFKTLYDTTEIIQTRPRDNYSRVRMLKGVGLRA